MSDTKKTNPKIIIAVDGYSSCGKSTFAKAIAARLGYIFIDTGAMYRAVTLYALEHGAIRSGMVDEEAVVKLLGEISITFRFNPSAEPATSTSTAIWSRERSERSRSRTASARSAPFPKCATSWWPCSRRWGAGAEW